jgi:hypothetical protein
MSHLNHAEVSSQSDSLETMRGAAEVLASMPQRDAKGKFIAGNKGGPGNPFGRKLASMRQAILRAVSEEDVERVMRTLVTLACEGNVAAAKLVLQYAVGKPQAAAEPDRVDVDEWDVHKDMVVSGDALDAAMSGMPAPLATVITTALAKAKGPKLAQMLDEADAEREALKREEQEEIEYYRQKRAREAQAVQPSRAAGNGHAGESQPSGRHPSVAELNGRGPSCAERNGQARGSKPNGDRPSIAELNGRGPSLAG